jgi:hypothetical protein
LRLTTSNFFRLKTCFHSPYVISSLTRDICAVYNYCWASPAQSFSCPSPAGLMTTFYWLRFETRPTWRVRSPYICPTGTGWPSYTPRRSVPFRRLLQFAGIRWRYSNPPIHRVLHFQSSLFLLITSRHGPHRKHLFSVDVRLLRSYLLRFPRDCYSAIT